MPVIESAAPYVSRRGVASAIRVAPGPAAVKALRSDDLDARRNPDALRRPGGKSSTGANGAPDRRGASRRQWMPSQSSSRYWKRPMSSDTRDMTV